MDRAFEEKRIAICVNNEHWEKVLTLGKEYEIQVFAAYTARALARFRDDNGKIEYLYAERFADFRVINDGANIEFFCCGEKVDLNSCEAKCPKYYSCDTVAMASDELKKYEEE